MRKIHTRQERFFSQTELHSAESPHFFSQNSFDQILFFLKKIMINYKIKINQHNHQNYNKKQLKYFVIGKNKTIPLLKAVELKILPI